MSRRVVWAAPVVGAACFISAALWVELFTRHYWNNRPTSALTR